MNQEDAQRFRDNVKLAMQVRPGLFDSCEALLGLADRLRIDREGERILCVRALEEGGEQTLYESACESLCKKQQAALQNNLEQGVRFQVIAGLGIGHVMESAHSLLQQYPRGAMALFETDWMRWAGLFALFDVREWLSQERLYLFAGENAPQNLVEFITQEYVYLLPTSQFAYVLGHLPRREDEAQFYMQKARQTAESIEQARQSFDQSLNTFLTAMKEPPQVFRTVWSCVSREAYIHFPLARAFMEGWEKQGFRSQLEPFDHQFTTNFRIVGHLVESRPDVFFSINTWPVEMLLDLGFQKETVESMPHPRVGWLVDDTRLYEDEFSPAPLTSWDFIFCIDRTYMETIRHPAQQVYFLPPASQFEKPGDYREEFAAPISYVGSLPDVMESLQRLPAGVRDLIERVERARQGEYRVSFVEHWRRLEAKDEERLLGVAREFCATTHKGFTNERAMLEYFLYNCATFLKRKRIVEALLPLGLKVFGPQAWLDWLPEEYKERYGGFVASRELADCYASAKISLNIHSHQCPTCLNPRDFDAAMAGSVVLGDWVEDMERDLFCPGKEIYAFHHEEEAVEKAQWLLHDEDQLDASQERVRRRILKEHLYEHRVQRVLEKIKASKG